MSVQNQHASPQGFYNAAYKTGNYFQHKEWLFRPYIKGLIALAGLGPGARVLDAGCGQGFFAHLFALEGMRVFATDISAVGLQMAQRYHGLHRVFVSDLYHPATKPTFDCVFVRSCSVHNTSDPQQFNALDNSLFAMVKPGGVLVVAYNTNLSGHAAPWRHHRLDDLRDYIAQSHLPAKLYFINKIDTLMFGALAFNRVFTSLNEMISTQTRLGGEAVALFRTNSKSPAGGDAALSSATSVAQRDRS
jgi:SAM-dependent methyltransferase